MAAEAVSCFRPMPRVYRFNIPAASAEPRAVTRFDLAGAGACLPGRSSSASGWQAGQRPTSAPSASSHLRILIHSMGRRQPTPRTLAATFTCAQRCRGPHGVTSCLWEQEDTLGLCGCRQSSVTHGRPRCWTLSWPGRVWLWERNGSGGSLAPAVRRGQTQRSCLA